MRSTKSKVDLGDKKKKSGKSSGRAAPREEPSAQSGGVAQLFKPKQKKKNQNNPISSSVTRQVSDVARHGPQADLSDTRHVILRPSILVFTEAKEEKEEEASGDATSAKER